MKLSEIIKQYRIQNNFTMQDFAERAGLSKGYISMLEKGKHPQSNRKLIPSIQTYAKVAAAMNLNIDELFSQLNDSEMVRLGTTESASGPLPQNSLSCDENQIITAYRMADDITKNMVKRCLGVENNKISEIKVSKNTDILRAAHKRTDIKTTEEMDRFDEDIMNDDDF